MCGRGAVFFPRRGLATLTRTNEDHWRDAALYHPTYNAGPGFYLPVLVCDAQGERHLHSMKWGLIPSFQKPSEMPDHFRMFNARSETINEKNVFKRLLKRNRCVVCFNGFYEWEKLPGGKKQPYFIRREEGEPLFFAGLFDLWKNVNDEELYSFTIITADSAKSKIRWLHDRIPVILDDDTKISSWLSSSQVDDDLLFQTYSGALEYYKVSPEVGKLSHNGPECIDVYVPPKPKREGANIMKMFQKKMKKEEEEGKPAATAATATATVVVKKED